MLPDRTGFALCEAVRSLTSAPILFLSCMDDEADKVKGLMAGGDDYITKPYSLKELAARVYAQVRRTAMRGLSIDHRQQLLTVDGRVIPLAPKEFDLFLYLMGNPGRILTAVDLLPGMRTFPGNGDPAAWYYLDLQEAANGHDYERKPDGVHETWTGLN